MSLDLGNLLQGQLGGILGQFLTGNGESAENSSQAAGLAIPAVIAGLIKHVSGNPSNASSVFDLIKGTSGSQLNGAVAQAAEGRDLGSLIDLGKGLLPSVFGGNAANVADQISQESGVSKASAGSLLALALPLVLSVLRGKAQTENLSQGQLLGLLGQQQGWLSRALSGNMLSALGISSLSGLFGGLSSMLGNGVGATTAATAATAGATAAAMPAVKKSGIGKWIALAVLAVLALIAFKGCGQHNNKPEPAASEPAAASVAATAAPQASAPAAAPAAPAEETARVTYEDRVAKFYFATGKSDVAEGADKTVADITKAGKDGKKLVISGFTDSTGNAVSNEELSKKRAEAVAEFFKAQGVSAANIELRKPENTTGAKGNDVEGRRVEVKVEG